MICRGCAEDRDRMVMHDPYRPSVKGPCVCCGKTYGARDLAVLEDWYNPQGRKAVRA